MVSGDVDPKEELARLAPVGAVVPASTPERPDALAAEGAMLDRRAVWLLPYVGRLGEGLVAHAGIISSSGAGMFSWWHGMQLSAK